MKNISNKEECLYTYSFKTRETHISNVKDLCKENFFYGSDEKSQTFENNLSKFEKEQANITRKIIDNNSIRFLTQDEYTKFILFLILQDARTKRSKREIKKFTQIMVQNYFKPLLKTKKRPPGIPEDFIDNLKISFSGDFALRMLGGICYVEGLSDLRAVLIFNITNRKFYCSDHPIVRYNYIKFKNSPSTDYLAPGLMIFYPINNENMILLFDEKAYHVYQDFDSVYILDKVADVESINKLQFISAVDCVLFSDQNEVENVKRIHREMSGYMGHDYHIEKTEKKHADGKRTVILRRHPKKLEFTLDLSFVSFNRKSVESCLKKFTKITKNNPRPRPIRNLRLSEKVEECQRKSEEKIIAIMNENHGRIFTYACPNLNALFYVLNISTSDNKFIRFSTLSRDSSIALSRSCSADCKNLIHHRAPIFRYIDRAPSFSTAMNAADGTPSRRQINRFRCWVCRNPFSIPLIS